MTDLRHILSRALADKRYPGTDFNRLTPWMQQTILAEVDRQIAAIKNAGVVVKKGAE